MFKYLLSALVLIGFTACQDSSRSGHIKYLDEMTFGEIADPYGPPQRNLSFAQDTLSIDGNLFNRGLGTHAPSRLEIGLDRKGIRFESVIGMDRSIAVFYDKETRDTLRNRAGYIYDNKIDHYDYTAGGTAIFIVVLDGKTVFVSDTLTIDSDPVKVSIPLSRSTTMELIVEDAGDGSFADYANWADAKIVSSDSAFRPVIRNQLDKVIVNTYGFHPSGKKYAYIHRGHDPGFRVIDAGSGTAVFEGTGIPAGGDLGEYLKCDLSALEAPGRYYVESDRTRSDTFVISPDIYSDALATHLEYITLQRSGHPEKGWAKNNHLDDGKRDDNGQHQDVTGGWYDACDIRKPAAGNAQLLFALTHVMEAQPPGIAFTDMVEEAKWGNKFLFSMQEPEGCLMHYIGFTWDGYWDNRWTDNIAGTEDDRTILTRPAELQTQLLFIIAQLKLATMLMESDPAYAEACMQRAMRCYRWVNGQEVRLIADHALLAIAGMHLAEITGNPVHGERAAAQIDKVCEAFEYDPDKGTALFRRSVRNSPLQEFGWAFYSMAEFAGRYPGHALNGRIGKITGIFTEEYLEPFGKQNVFSILPWLVSSGEMEGGRTLDNYHYKYFLHVGMNRHLALDAFGLLKFLELTADSEPGSTDRLEIVHGHYDWILGANPYNASTVSGIGQNQPDLFKTNAYEFKPPTPVLPGGVMTGIGGTPDDRIALRPGWWWTTEYWSPTVMATMLLTNELNLYYSSGER